MTWRSSKTQALYEEFKSKLSVLEKKEFFLDPYKKVVKEYGHWTIRENDFPYDEVASTHHLLVSKRQFTSLDEAKAEEKNERHKILRELNEENFYDSVTRMFTKGSSVRGHYHEHLFVEK